MFLLTISLIYFLIGSGVKYLDAAYDDDTFSRRYSVPLALGLGTLAGCTMLWDRLTCVIFLSLIIGVTITRKLDILPFRLMVTVAVLLPLIFYGGNLPFGGSDYSLIALISVGAAIDEIGNDLADARILKRAIGTFFLYRGYLKFVVALIAFVSYLPVSHAIAFICFDLGYLLFTRLSEHRASSRVFDPPAHF